MKKIVVIIFGPPGSGKSTQADLIAKYFNLTHFNTGKFLESIVFDPKRQKEKIIQREAKLFKSGKLMTPSFVTAEIKKAIIKISKAGWGIVFSGSPRTLYEAQKEIPLLIKQYGKENLFFIALNISEKEAAKRNTNRLICRICGYVLLTKYFPVKNIKNCPVCGGQLYKRILDDPNVIKIRFKEYRERTKPVFEFIKQSGFKINQISASPPPYKIFQKIINLIK